jgi:hypothetical protein
MSEWLTTGQMIDRLKVGEVAVPNNREYLPVKRTEKGFIWVDPKTHEQSKIHQDYFRIDRYTLDIKWSIIPKYVTFSEAMKALMNGKTVWVWVSDKKEAGYYIDKENGKLWAIVRNCTVPVENIYFGDKWTIEE